MKNSLTRTLSRSLLVAAMAGISTGALAEDPNAAQLAEAYGCTSCHAEKSAAAGDPLPIGPSFEAIAARYFEAEANDTDDHYQSLYRVVKYGSSPYSSHYKGKISGLAMPPNDRTVSDLDINRLLVWILDSHRPQ